MSSFQYWLFQGNPDDYDFELAIKDKVLDTWAVTSHSNKISKGDKVIIWLSGKNSGVGGLANIISDVRADIVIKDEHCWTEKGRKKRARKSKLEINYAVQIEIVTDHVFFINPKQIDKTLLKEYKFYVGRGYQNTNYRSSIEQYTLVQSLIESSMTDTENINEFPEGAIAFRTHQARERNGQLVLLAKEKFRQKNNGKLFCQICEIDFEDRYGEIGKDFIEAHHTIPVSEMEEGHKTRIEDIAMLCPNCHRMIHKKRPWLHMEALRSLLK